MSIDRISILADRGDLAFVELDCAACGSRTMSLVLRAGSGAGEPVLDTAVHPRAGAARRTRGWPGGPRSARTTWSRSRACSRPGTATSGRCSRVAATPRRSRRADPGRGVRAGRDARAVVRARQRGRAGADPRLLRGPLGVRAATRSRSCWNLDGDVVESFSPDFYLPDLDLYVELTTLKQRLVRKKNRKLRRLRELYPDIRIKLFYARDFRALMLKYGRMALVDELAGTTGQVMPPRAAVEAAARAADAAADPAIAACWPSGRPTRSASSPRGRRHAAGGRRRDAVTAASSRGARAVNGTARGRRRATPPPAAGVAAAACARPQAR